VAALFPEVVAVVQQCVFVDDISELIEELKDLDSAQRKLRSPLKVGLRTPTKSQEKTPVKCSLRSPVKNRAQLKEVISSISF